MVARCLDLWLAHPQAPQAPYFRCSCGLYATKTLNQAMGAVYSRSRNVIGRVALWGEVVIHEEGYRAQYGYPQALYVLSDSAGMFHGTALRLRHYGVPVLPTEELGIALAPYSARPVWLPVR